MVDSRRSSGGVGWPSQQRRQQQQQQQQQSPRQHGQREAAAAAAAAPGNGGVTRRKRSESCGDELLAAGRVTTEEAFGSSCSCSCGGGGGGEEGAKVGLAEAAETGASTGGEALPGRSHVSRSQSLDLGTAAVAAVGGDGGGMDRRDLSLSREEDLSRRKVRENRGVVCACCCTRRTARGGRGAPCLPPGMVAFVF